MFGVYVIVVCGDGCCIVYCCCGGRSVVVWCMVMGTWVHEYMMVYDAVVLVAVRWCVVCVVMVGSV